MKHMGGRNYELWDEEDGFFYDVLRYPDGHFEKFRVRSLVGLIPLYAVERLETDWIAPFPEFTREPQLVPREPPGSGPARACNRIAAMASGETLALTIVDREQLERMLQLAGRSRTSSCRDFGLRSLSKAHLAAPVRARRHAR